MYYIAIDHGTKSVHYGDSSYPVMIKRSSSNFYTFYSWLDMTTELYFIGVKYPTYYYKKVLD